MAQTGAAVRAYVAVDVTPEVVLARLDLLFATYAMTHQLVTLVYLVVDPQRHELTVANAGHPPPVVLRRDGGVEQLPTAVGAPLGTIPGNRRPVKVAFHAGDALVVFTDGLIERRGEDIDQGQRRLLDAVRVLGQLPLTEALPVLVETVRDPTREDDVAVLVVRRTTH